METCLRSNHRHRDFPRSTTRYEAHECSLFIILTPSSRSLAMKFGDVVARFEPRSRTRAAAHQRALSHRIFFRDASHARESNGIRFANAQYARETKRARGQAKSFAHPRVRALRSLERERGPNAVVLLVRAMNARFTSLKTSRDAFVLTTWRAIFRRAAW